MSRLFDAALSALVLVVAIEAAILTAVILVALARGLVR